MASGSGTIFVGDAETTDLFIKYFFTTIIGFVVAWLINRAFKMPVDPLDVNVDFPPLPLVEPEPNISWFHLPTPVIPPPPPQIIEPEISEHVTIQIDLSPSHPSRLSRRFNIIIYSLAIVGTITIGFTTAFIGSVMSTPKFMEYFFHAMLEKKNHAHSTNFCNFDNPIFLSLTSVVPLTNSIAVWLAYFLGKSHGRKIVLSCGASLLLIGILCVVFPLHHETRWTIILGLVVIGSGTGFLAEVIPTILGESLPSGSQKFGATLFGYQILGQVLGYGANYYVSYSYPIIWRLPFIILGALAFLLLVVSFWINETPRYLVGKQKLGQALVVLRQNRNGWQDDEIDREWTELVDTVHQEATVNMFNELRSRCIRPTLVIKVGSQVLPLLVGTVPISFFGPLVTMSASSIKHGDVLTPLVSGILGVICTILASSVLHQFRTRRPLLIGSSLLILLLQIGLWIIFTFHVDPLTNIKRSVSLWATALLIVNAGSNNVLTNPHGWISCSVSGASAPLVSVAMRSVTALVTGVMTYLSIHLLCRLKGWVFMLDVSFSIILLAFMLLFVPETTGIDESQIDDHVWRHHWFWKRYMR